MEVSVTLHSHTCRRQPEHTKYLRTKSSEEAVAKEGTASEVRPRIRINSFPTETKEGSNHFSSLGRAEAVEGMCYNPKTCSLTLKISSVSLKLPNQALLN